LPKTRLGTIISSGGFIKKLFSNLNLKTCKIIFVGFFIFLLGLSYFPNVPTAHAAAGLRWESPKSIVSTIPGFEDNYSNMSRASLPKELNDQFSIDPGVWAAVCGNCARNGAQDYFFYTSTKSYKAPPSDSNGFYDVRFLLVRMDNPGTGTIYYLTKDSAGRKAVKPVPGQENISIDDAAAKGPKPGAWVKVGYYLAFPKEQVSMIADAQNWFGANFVNVLLRKQVTSVNVTGDLGENFYFENANIAWANNQKDLGNGVVGVWLNDAKTPTWLRPGGAYTATFNLVSGSQTSTDVKGKSTTANVSFNVTPAGFIEIDAPYPNPKGDGIPAKGVNIKTLAAGTKVDILMAATISEVDAVTYAMTKVLGTFIDALKQFITITAGWINGILLAGNDINNKAPLKAAWTNILNLILSLLTLALLIIAFANILNLDEKLGYGLNRMIPKIILSIFMAYFSFLVARVLLDLTNAFQVALFNLPGAQNAPQTAALLPVNGLQSATSLASGIGLMIFVVILMAFLFIVMLWLCILLLVRNAMIWILVALAPAAMLMNIMPFTESFYKKWWEEWWKWLFMGPAIALMLYLASVVLTAGLSSFATGGTYDAFLSLILAAICIGMAGTIPLTLGGKIMATAAKPLKGLGKLAASPVTNRWGEFKSQRQNYDKQKARKDVSGYRSRLSGIPGFGRKIAGTGGILGTDSELAVMAEGEIVKNMGDKEKFAALKAAGGAEAAEAGSARAIALMQSLAKDTHTGGYAIRNEQGKVVDDYVRTEMAKAVGSSSTNLGGVQSAIKGNPNSDAARDLFNEVTPKSIGAGRYAKLAQEAAKKSAGKTTFETDGDDIKALEKIATDLRGIEKDLKQEGKMLDKKTCEALSLSEQTVQRHKEFFRHPENQQSYKEKTTQKRQQEHAERGPEYRFSGNHTPSDEANGSSLL
jgi:hypothetical protein